MRKVILSVLFAAFPVSVMAQRPPQPPYERVLVPIYTGNVPVGGAYGSIWTTPLSARNESDEGVVIVDDPGSICVTVCPVVAAHSTVSIISSVPYNPNAGMFLFVGNPGLGKVSFALRIQDISRQRETWGTTIPVLRERDFFTGSLQLLDVPTGGDFRSSLRVYDFDRRDPNWASARVRIYPAEREDVLVDTELTLSSPGGAANPPAAFVGDLKAVFPELAGESRVRIRIDPVTPNLRFWAFSSVTNNATQHVTVVLPDKP